MNIQIESVRIALMFFLSDHYLHWVKLYEHPQKVESPTSKPPTMSGIYSMQLGFSHFWRHHGSFWSHYIVFNRHLASSSHTSQRIVPSSHKLGPKLYRQFFLWTIWGHGKQCREQQYFPETSQEYLSRTYLPICAFLSKWDTSKSKLYHPGPNYITRLCMIRG